jgi:Ser/Thr protein kinase RdoA (MazF antagonist)
MTTPNITLSAAPDLKQLSEPDARRFAAGTVELYGFAPDAGFDLLSYRENAVYRVTQPGAEPMVLKVLRPGYHSKAALLSDIAWCDELRANGVENAPALANRDGQRLTRLGEVDGTPVYGVLYSWLDGTPPQDDEIVDTYHQLGAASARVHKISSAWTRPDWFERHSWDADGLVGPDPFWGRFLDLPVLTDAQRDLFDRAATRVHAQLQNFGTGPDRFGLIHADLSPENIFVHEGKVRIIDFGDAGYGWFLSDLATSLSLLLTEDYVTDARDAWVTGYREVSDLPDSHLQHLPALLVARLLSGLGWMHTRSKTEMAQTMTEPVVDLAEYYASEYLADRAL